MQPARRSSAESAERFARLFTQRTGGMLSHCDKCRIDGHSTLECYSPQRLPRSRSLMAVYWARSEGATISEAARQFGVKPPTVYRAWRALGFGMVRPADRQRCSTGMRVEESVPERVQLVLGMAANGSLLRDIAEAAGMSAPTVRRIMRDHGVYDDWKQR